jgi:hypothetical protein
MSSFIPKVSSKIPTNKSLFGGVTNHCCLEKEKEAQPYKYRPLVHPFMIIKEEAPIQLEKCQFGWNSVYFLIFEAPKQALSKEFSKRKKHTMVKFGKVSKSS